MRKISFKKLGVMVAAVALYSNAHAAVNAVAMEANGIPTSVLNLVGLGTTATVVNQITFPTVFVGPVYEGWYSTIRVCFDGVSILGLSLATSVNAQFAIINDAGTTVKSINTTINANSCVTYTSDSSSDPLFGGVTLGLYKVRVTNNLTSIIALGSLNGVVNSTGRSVASNGLRIFLEKAKKAQAEAGY